MRLGRTSGLRSASPSGEVNPTRTGSPRVGLSSVKEATGEAMDSDRRSGTRTNRRLHDTGSCGPNPRTKCRTVPHHVRRNDLHGPHRAWAGWVGPGVGHQRPRRACAVPLGVHHSSLSTGESSTFVISKEAAERPATTTCHFEQTFTNPQTGETHQVVGVLQVLSHPLSS